MTDATDSSKWFRLPRNVVPTHYDITLKSDLEALRFSGTATIDLDVLEDTKEIVFNAAAKLHLSKSLVLSQALKTDSKSVVALDIDTKHERATAKLPNVLPKGSKAQLVVAFASDIDNSMMGYYRSTWEHEGNKGYYALTQFEPTAARRAIPTWDEPNLKATYTFRMIHRKETTALANMNVVSTKDISQVEQDKILRAAELGLDEASLSKTQGKTEGTTEGSTKVPSTASNDWTLTEFATTPKVSTYLVAWANGPFVSLESSYTSPLTGKVIPMKVYTTPEYIHQAQYALDVKVKVLPEYERVFDVAYPLPKLDTLVASDFDAGAMENWGLITGRTSVYLYDDEKSGLQGQKRTASVQSHEVAHQWFGNIATLDWWDNLWLNEAFATLMGEVVILDRCFPEWESASEFINTHLDRALDLDGKRSSHPIEVPLQGENVEDAINQVFDAISYSKGASVLRMLSNMIGEDVFLKGVSIYLKKHLYANAVTKDLWNGISESSGKDIASIMQNWILQQGFPVLTVAEEADGLRITQNRFLSTGDPAPEEDETLWYVPLMLKTIGKDGKVTVDRGAFLKSEREVKIPLENVQDTTYKLNAETIGVYRVAYSPERLAKLGEEAAKEKSAFSLEDRVGLVSDAFTLASAGYGKTSGGLSLLKALRNDPTYLVNSASSLNIGTLSSAWWEQDPKVQNAIKKLRADIFGPTAKKLGFEFGPNDSPDLKQLRAVAISAAANGEDEWTLSEIKKRFDHTVATGDDSQIHPDLLRTVFSRAVEHGGEKEYEAVLAIYRKPQTPTHKIAAMLALGAPTEAKLLDRTVEFLYSNEVKEQDFMYFFAALSGNPKGRRIIWEATKARWDVLSKRFAGNFSLSRLIEYSFSAFSSEKDAQDVEDFFKGKDTAKFSMGLSQGLDAVRSKARWVERDSKDVEEWLKSNGYLA
ncbi:probable AAP1 - alanine/arginine aminopeptidase [Melanopsichium pennsylvanicum]|uniref:Aminopeptidase n=2 Tax=Melanopsichium pennsylvanicum TaxID=63383 RepID=A0AAJ5C4Y7_9BASI|nr:probable AAP1-alanine/arginine aminopeptidase [Melanopsichium pennsylvanicum 4]SNX84196.1 probable AAP1 - alanine/arginine aminopeptidase [Melanopsichium pennsylvanicum]